MGDAESVGLLEKKYSRRSFIKGVIAVGATASSTGYLLGGAQALGAQSMPGATERLITLNINGQDRRVDVLPNETLAMTLRYRLNMTGTKLGCDRAECGACTVLIDGVNHYGCSMLTHQVRGRAVTTIEGLENPDTGELSIVQQAVLEAGWIPMCFLRSGLHHEHGSDDPGESEPDARGSSSRTLRQPLQVRRLRQDPHLRDASCRARTQRLGERHG